MKIGRAVFMGLHRMGTELIGISILVTNSSHYVPNFT
jgi:hypothetical protein